MALTIAIEPRRSINAARASAGALSLIGALSHVVAPGPPSTQPPVFKSVTGTLAPVGALSSVVSGPSIETKSQFVSGAIVPQGGYSDDIIEGPPIGVSTLDVAGSVDLTGIVAGEVSGPSIVTITADFAGSLVPSSTLDRVAITPEPPPPTVLTQDVDGTITPAGDVATAVSGPSIETLTQDVDGTITPAGDLTTDTIAPPVTEFFQDVAGELGLSGDVDGVKSGPDLITVPKSVSGSLGLSTTLEPVIAPTFATKLQSIAGTVLSSSSLVTAVSGPSIETKLKTVTGSITPAGARSAIVIAPPPTFFSQDVAGMLTLTGTVSRLVTGPSIETKVKTVVGSIAPSSVVVRQVSGPSFETKPKTVSGLITPHGTVTRLVTNNPQILTKTVTGTITPQGARSAIVIAGPPTGAQPLYTSMGAWTVDKFDLFPQWPAITFTRVPSSTNGCKTMFDAMRARGMKGGPALTNKDDMANPAPGGGFIFSMTKYKAVVDRVAAVPNLSSYISDGTFTLFCIGDEFQHNLWNDSIDGNDIKEMALYAKSKFPGVLIAVRMRAQQLADSAWIPTGGWAGSLDAGWAQYVGPDRVGANGDTALEYYIHQRDDFVSVGIPKIVCGLNWWNGGDGSSGIEGPQEGQPGANGDWWVVSPQEIRDAIDGAVQIPECDYFMFWTDAHNSNLSGAADMLALQESTPYENAFMYAKTTGLARGGTVAPPVYFTDSSHFAAPHPPPALPLGAGVRDSLTDHKVFRLVDNARLQDSEYVAFNSDNSLIYYIKGTTGYIADVFWNVGQSQVQVSGERVANGITNPAPVYDGWIWARNDRRFAYFAASPAPSRICRRDVTLNVTTTLKNFDTDSRFSSFWAATGVTSTRLTGLHANKNQEVYAAKVHNGNGGAVIGAVAWRSTDGLLWNYQPPTGKTVDKVLTDDAGAYIVVILTDGSWQVGLLNANGTVTKSANQSGGPVRLDTGLVAGSQQALQASGLGLRIWDIDPIASSPTLVYAHPQRSSNQDLYQQARISAPYQTQAAYMLYYDTTIATAWVQHSGAIYKVNWAAELVARPHKDVPEVVRQGKLQLTRVT